MGEVRLHWRFMGSDGWHCRSVPGLFLRIRGDAETPYVGVVFDERAGARWGLAIHTTEPHRTRETCARWVKGYVRAMGLVE